MPFIPEEEYQKQIGGQTGFIPEQPFVPEQPKIPFLPSQQEDWRFSTKRMIGNIPRSGKEFVSGIKEAVTHPIQTIKGLGRIGAGAVESLPLPLIGKPEATSQNKQAFQNVKNFFIDRYGSPEKALKSLEEDPVGVAADVSILLTGGKSLLAKTKLAKPLGVAAKITEPITATAKAGGIITKPIIKGTTILGKGSLGVTTGVGGETLKTAFQAGRTGGGKFTQALRGRISQQDVLSVAKEGLETIENQRATVYRTQLRQIKDITKPIDIKPIKAKITTLLDKDNYNIKIGAGGKLNFSKSTIADIAEQKRISSVINETLKWTDNTPAGLDILKRRLDDFYTTSGQGRALTNSIRGEVNNLLTKNVKGYAEMTKGYREVSQLINELENTLSLKTGAAIDTTLKKLTSALKNDVSFRRELLMKLDDATQADIAGQLAGSILNPVVPSGLIGRSIFAGGPTAIFLGKGTISPAMLYPLLMSSPRVVGELFHALGIGAKYADNIMKFLEKMKVAETGRAISRPLFQAGRLQLKLKE